MIVSYPRPWLLMLSLAACGDDLPTNADASGGDSTTALPATGSTTAADASGSGETAVDSTGTGDAPLAVEVEVVTYPEQPMVADVVLLPSGSATATVTHPDDGVRVGQLPADGDTIRFRLRGMLPGRAHTIEYTVEDADEVVQNTTQFELPPALPGFQPVFTVEATAQDPVPGYRLFDHAPFPITGAVGMFMVDTAGVTRWYLGAETTTINADAIWAAAKLLPDGSVLYLQDNTIWRRDELGDVIWELSAATLGVPAVHHEVMVLPDGNILALGLSFQDVDYPAQGTVHVAGDTVLELTPQGDVVWEWDSFDHLDPQRIRDGFDLQIFNPETGLAAQDWTHANGAVYEPDTDTVLVSMRHQDWLIRIDRATGDIVWRLGPEGDFTLDQGRWFFHQHSPQWQPDGSLMLYDNGVGNPSLPDDQERSRAVRYTIDEAMGVASEVWSDEDGVPAFNSMLAGDADRLTEDRIQVLDSFILSPEADFIPYARLRELSPQGDPTPLWTLQTSPGHFIYRSTAHDRLVGEVASE